MAAEDSVVELAYRHARRGVGMTAGAEAPIARLARGEAGAVKSCVDMYGPLIQALVRRMLPDASELEDAIQEVFVALWQSAHRFDPAKATDRGFVAMIARRRLIDRIRRSERRPSTVPESPRTDVATDEHERILGRVQAGPALQALDTIAGDRRRWIVMAVVEGYSHSEIAQETGTPLGTVKSGIRRGLADMRSWLERIENREVGP